MENVREKISERWVFFWVGVSRRLISLRLFLSIVAAPSFFKWLRTAARRSGLCDAWEWVWRSRELSESERDRLLGFALASFAFIHVGVAWKLSSGIYSQFFFFTIYVLIFVAMLFFLPFVRTWLRDGVSPDETLFPGDPGDYRPIGYCSRLLWSFFAEEAWLLIKCLMVLGAFALFALPRVFSH
jgi:hypothetical protein